jgi:hypothetical protein
LYHSCHPESTLSEQIAILRGEWELKTSKHPHRRQKSDRAVNPQDDTSRQNRPPHRTPGLLHPACDQRGSYPWQVDDQDLTGWSPLCRC